MRKLATAAFSFSIAIFASHFLIPYEFLIMSACIALVLGIVGVAYTIVIKRRYALYNENVVMRGFTLPKKACLRIVIVLFSLSAGFLWSFIYDSVFVRPHWELQDSSEIVSAVVTDYSVARDSRGYYADVKIERDNSTQVGARLYYYNDIALKPGDIIQAAVKLRRSDINSDGERYDTLTSKGIFLSGYVSGDVEVTGTYDGVKYIPKVIAENIAEKTREVYSDDISHFLTALLIGKRDELNKDVTLNAVLSGSGIVHIVSISGMHISFLMGFLAIVLRNKRMLALYGIPALIVFMAMAGFTPSVTRAGIMQIMLICAPLFKRDSDSITSISVALLIILSINPYACASVGLQLSFAATLGIILFTTRINNAVVDFMHGKSFYKKKVVRAIINYITASFATTIGALILTLPLSTIHFGYISLVSPLANLFTIGVVSLAFPLGLLAAILGFIHPIVASITAFPVEIMVRYIIAVAGIFSAMPYAVVYSSDAHIMIWLAYVYVMFITLPMLKVRLRQYIYPICISIILLIAVILLSHFMPLADENVITVLDVGQGQSVVVTSGENTMVIDCGSISTSRAGAITHEFLQNINRISVDLLVITHFHDDHINGMEFLLSRIKVSTLVIPDPEGSYAAEDIIDLARKQRTDIIYVTGTIETTLGELGVTFYPPLGFGDENERGLSILTTGNLVSLITGDMDSPTERALLRFADLPKLDLLIAGHHGSRNSSSDELLTALMPDMAVISVGRNSFGHPHPDTLDRFSNIGAVVYRTDELGHVAIGGR